MKIKLISYSQSDEHKSIEDIICFCARVSNPTNQYNTETNDKLIKYLMNNKHWSPFEMVNICLEINTTRDIARQILRHRSFSFQEFSQRYAVVDGVYELKEARLQDHKNRQNSIEINNPELQNEWLDKQKHLLEKVDDVYQWALQNGIAKEVARCVLPEGMTPSVLYMNGTLRSWIHYLDLRTKNGTQKEHQEIALECLQVIETIFPFIKNIF